MHVLLISFLLYISLQNHNFSKKKYTEVISCLILIKIYSNKLKAIMYVVFCSYFQFFFWRSMVSNIHDFNTNLNLHKYYHCIVATININNPDHNPTAKKVKATPRSEKVIIILTIASCDNNKVSDCCLMPNNQFFSHIMAKTSYIRWDDNDVFFVPNQHVYLDILIVLAHWKYSRRIHMLLHSDTLTRFRVE